MFILFLLIYSISRKSCSNKNVTVSKTYEIFHIIFHEPTFITTLDRYFLEQTSQTPNSRTHQAHGENSGKYGKDRRLPGAYFPSSNFLKMPFRTTTSIFFEKTFFKFAIFLNFEISSFFCKNSIFWRKKTFL